ncbi:Uncharacterised protein [Mycobacteroides abscessus subsp. abscessus]|nr:hypothetical protein [Mycobacteroides abscessus]SHX89693.1 Uncharacterised protein [Mycobacteroides abscessus subsp. abscessus]SIF60655.1 Uncharacterised protein [Mycobacteroides abscessus subsp. abscessus]
MSDHASAIRKLMGYANGSYHPEYIHFTQEEAQAVLRALERLADLNV